MAVKEIERPLSISELTTNRLRESIVNGDLTLGEAVSEVKLSEILKVSKTPVRHALAQMKVEGLVTVIPQKGTYIFSLRYEDLIEFNEHRAIIERNALRFSFERNRSPLCINLEKIVDKMSKSRDDENQGKYLRLDSEFHDVLVRYSGNHYLYESYNLISAKAAALRTHLADKPMQTKKSYSEHIKILDELNHGDLNKAVEVLDFHIGRHIRSYGQNISDIAELS